jgi:GNAT superfamily N-acetyltransferase
LFLHHLTGWSIAGQYPVTNVAFPEITPIITATLKVRGIPLTLSGSIFTISGGKPFPGIDPLETSGKIIYSATAQKLLHPFFNFPKQFDPLPTIDASYMDFKIQKTDTADPAARQAILDGLVAYNDAKTGPNDYHPLAILITDDSGSVIGGLWGRTVYDWLFTELLFVPESLRGQGIGRSLILKAEQEALSRGCHSAWLDTFEFQARGFYERMGYECFGELSDYPVGFSRFFMKKRLTYPKACLKKLDQTRGAEIADKNGYRSYIN